MNSDVTLTPISNVRNHPYVGFILAKPLSIDLALRANIGYWKYIGTKSFTDERKLEIMTFLLDLKYALLSDVRLMPYVSYGIGWFLGSESAPEDALLEFDSRSEMGLGFNVGTGFDLNVYKKLFVTIDFRYLYVKFNKTIAFTDLYSGPRISAGFNVNF